MFDELSAPCPRRLRVRPSLQVAGQRVPAYGFLVVVAVGLFSLVGVMLGTSLERMLWVSGALILVGLLLVEGRLWGRTSPQVATILWRQLRRPRRMRLAPRNIILPAEVAESRAMARRPRWQMEAPDA